MDWKRISFFFLTVVIVLGAIGATSPRLVERIKLGLDLKGGFEILYTAEPLAAGAPLTKETLTQAAESLAKRADSLGVAEPEVYPEGTDRIRVRLAGVENEEEVRALMSKPSVLTFRGPDGTVYMNGTDFVENAAKLSYDPNTKQPIVEIKMKSREKFKEVTTKLVGSTLSIFLDDQVQSTASVNFPIDSDSAIITQTSVAEATKVAKMINLGAMPLKLTEKYIQRVDATLGTASLHQTARAGLIASILIFIFMVLYYRAPGLVAAFTLITYVWVLLAIFDFMNATLTLPGIAALVLGAGMAVDANIITYERIREEIRAGKSILSSLKSGSKHSFRTIMDANVTNLIAGIVLYYVGNGAIRGFAVITMMSIIISILTNVLFSRWLLHLIIRGNLLKKPSYFGVKEADIRGL
ncbi:protein translocase subunit SecD [Paenibacillus alginolyticus]|uniref:Protein translocase subunit SecD n=1 Tax=Paenibacillus alginolyticus TaxID=59839 RepID=A0ABT4GDH2_9BACL|nr:protein translocase subunit SecD [Paenibacillus alginolyticus]MCY9694241.1 protein translocase subunit SecD [Paenibacillus alginolyticus]MEC0142791.1 protein translocase subunit SecD [Paenibacillus alginolyticus]